MRYHSLIPNTNKLCVVCVDTKIDLMKYTRFVQNIDIANAWNGLIMKVSPLIYNSALYLRKIVI